MKLSGLTDMESMPHATRNSANSGMIARRLAAQPDLGAGLVGLADDALDHPLHRLVLLVEQLGQLLRIAIDAERELREVIAADREAVEALGEGLGQDDVRRESRT